jgi:hypothetical protein
MELIPIYQDIYDTALELRRIRLMLRQKYRQARASYQLTEKLSPSKAGSTFGGTFARSQP